MALINKLLEHKNEFNSIFNEEIYNIDGLINSHLRAWAQSRIYGVSSSMAFYNEEIDAIKLIDKLAKEEFNR
jgi:hypothetical protein